jgi:hypothetical protein
VGFASASAAIELSQGGRGFRFAHPASRSRLQPVVCRNTFASCYGYRRCCSRPLVPASLIALSLQQESVAISRSTRASFDPETDALPSLDAGQRDRPTAPAAAFIPRFRPLLIALWSCTAIASPAINNASLPKQLIPCHGVLTTTNLGLCRPAPRLHGSRTPLGPAARPISATRRWLGRHPLRPPKCQNRVLQRRIPLALGRPADSSRAGRRAGIAFLVLPDGADHCSRCVPPGMM